MAAEFAALEEPVVEKTVELIPAEEEVAVEAMEDTEAHAASEEQAEVDFPRQYWGTYATGWAAEDLGLTWEAESRGFIDLPHETIRVEITKKHGTIHIAGVYSGGELKLCGKETCAGNISGNWENPGAMNGCFALMRRDATPPSELSRSAKVFAQVAVQEPPAEHHLAWHRRRSSEPGRHHGAPGPAASSSRATPRRNGHRKSDMKRCVVIMFDTLCRHILPCYNPKTEVRAPNFERLSKKAAQYQNFYIGSMPCMPARREMHTGRHNFLHRSWGPLEPFDDSMPEMLSHNEIHSHIVTDHYHYWEDGGSTYHNRYTTYDFVRGQEGDKWKANAEKLRKCNRPNFLAPGTEVNMQHIQDDINRDHMKRKEDMPQYRTFESGLQFIEEHLEADRWYLQIETFDPHEPFFTVEEFRKEYPEAEFDKDFAEYEDKDYDGPECDWFDYGRKVFANNKIAPHLRHMYYSLVAFCDWQLGKVLDMFDKHSLWEDTMLIVNTDHGLMMGEDDFWGKTQMPYTQEVAHIPFWIHDPRSPAPPSTRRHELATTVDIPVTVLDYFGLQPTKDMQGMVLRQNPEPARQSVIFGVFGGQVNVTDGKFVYMRGPKNERNQPLFEYTWMPTRMTRLFTPTELQSAEMCRGWSFTKGKIVRIHDGRQNHRIWHAKTMRTLLYDVRKSDGEVLQHLIDDQEQEARMLSLLVRAMNENDAPEEQYQRLHLPRVTSARPDFFRQYCAILSEVAERALGSTASPSATALSVSTPSRGAVRGCTNPACSYARSDYPKHKGYCCCMCRDHHRSGLPKQAIQHGENCCGNGQLQDVSSREEAKRRRQKAAAEEWHRQQLEEQARKRRLQEQKREDELKAKKETWKREILEQRQRGAEGLKARPPIASSPSTASSSAAQDVQQVPEKAKAKPQPLEPRPEETRRCQECRDGFPAKEAEDWGKIGEGKWYCFRCLSRWQGTTLATVEFLLTYALAEVKHRRTPSEQQNRKVCGQCKSPKASSHGHVDKGIFYCFECYYLHFQENDQGSSTGKRKVKEFGDLLEKFRAVSKDIAG